VRVIVVTGMGRAFCDEYDIEDMVDSPAPAAVFYNEKTGES